MVEYVLRPEIPRDCKSYIKCFAKSLLETMRESRVDPTQSLGYYYFNKFMTSRFSLRCSHSFYGFYTYQWTKPLLSHLKPYNLLSDLVICTFTLL